MKKTILTVIVLMIGFIEITEAKAKWISAQICNSRDAFTGWLWKPGTPTGKATELLTRDGE